ncbi:MAG: HD domain-containing protein, partial [Coriobacteriia bacterium]|nr:HD domain-containing protein [Coriobacteriia bacterium]
KYHCYDVWEHIAHAVASAVPDPLVRLTLLFHDFGKPERFAIDAAGAGHFYAHEEAGSRIAPARLRELRFDNRTVETVTKLVKWHGTVLRAEDMPRWLNRLGLKGLRQLIEVKRGDMRAHSDINMQERLETLLVVEKALEEYLADEPCFTLATLAINGDDLRGLGLTEGPFIGELLNTLLDAVLDGALENERAVLLSTARSLIINQMSALD